MNVYVETVTIKLSGEEAWFLSCAIMSSITNDVDHFKKYGYGSFMEQNRANIDMARSLAFTGDHWIDAKLEEFKQAIAEDAGND